MQKAARIALAAFIITGCACSSIWANAIADRMTDSLLSLEAMDGEVSQTGLLPGKPKTAVVEKVLYRKPWKLRVELTSPAEQQGTLFQYDGSQSLWWWPREQFGIRVSHIANPDRDQIYRHLERESDIALHDYAFSLNRQEKVAGVTANLWKVIPMTDDGRHHRHDMWMYERYAWPMKVRLYRPDGSVLYGMEYTRADFAATPADHDFAFRFPDNAQVVDWDLDDPAVSEDEARRTLNFTLMLPKALPAPLTVVKHVKARGSVPMLATVMDHGGSRLALYQWRYWGDSPMLHYGIGVSVGESAGRLSFMGPFSSVVWVRDHTLLTLVGNLSYPQLLQIAASVR